MADAFGDRQNSFPSGERFAQDAREEGRSGFIWLSWPNTNSRKKDTDSIKEPTARIVGKQQFSHCLLRSVAGQRRREEFIRDRKRKRGTKYGDGRCEHHARLVRCFQAL